MVSQEQKVTYDENSIDVLEGLEAVRKRPAMYIGNGGRFAVLKEALDNAIDEATAGYSKIVKCVVQDEFTFYVCDEGRGIPVGIHPKFEKQKISTLEIILTKLHAGGKLRKGAYAGGSIGTHGVGISCTNALSKYFQCWTFRDGNWYTETFEYGKPTSKVVKIPSTKLPFKQQKGTIIKFVCDETILKTPLKTESIRDYLENCSFLNSGIEFVYTDLKTNETKTYKANGLQDFIKKITTKEGEQKFESLGKPFIFKNENIDVCLQWFESEENDLNSWVNSSKTVEGGTHVDGLVKVITNCFGKVAKKKNYKPEDLRVGLYGGLNYRVSEPQFDSQTKEKLINPDATKIVYEAIEKEFDKYLNSNKSFTKRIIDRANEMRSIYNKFVSEKKALSKVKTKGKASLPPPTKFVVSNCKEDSLRELVIVEGESAGGTAKAARNPYYQEILKLRGKILNTAKANLSKVYESEDILNILKAIGFDPVNRNHNIRVGKVIILTDADTDGLHISVLLLTLFKYFYPELLEQGKVFCVDAPLFIGKTRTRTLYGADLQDLQKQSGNEKLLSVTRLKGWGESLNFGTLINTTAGVKRIEDVSIGDSVATSFGSNSVQNTFSYEERETRTLRTAEGYEISGNPEHPFLTINKNGLLEWKKLKDINSKIDYVALSRGNEIFSEKELALDFKFEKNNHCKLENFECPKTMTRELARLLGYMVGDGGGYAGISSGIYEDVVEDQIRCIKACFPQAEPVVSYKPTKDGLRNNYTLTLSRNAKRGVKEQINKFLRFVGLKGNAYTKEVPWSILASKKEYVCEFLKGLFECDGYLNAKKCEYYTASRKLHDQVKLLLLNLGIVTSSVNEKRRYNPFTGKTNNIQKNVLFITTDNIDTYWEKIGIVAKEKRERYYKLKRNPNKDIIPYIKRGLESYDKVRCKKYQPYFEIDGQTVKAKISVKGSDENLSYSRFFSLEKDRGFISEVAKVDSGIAETLQFCLDNKVFWSKVKTNRKTKEKYRQADLTLPEQQKPFEGHSYVANGFIVHNCSEALLRTLAFDPSTRNLIQIKDITTKQDLDLFKKLVGEDTEIRKQLLLQK